MKRVGLGRAAIPAGFLVVWAFAVFVACGAEPRVRADDDSIPATSGSATSNQPYIDHIKEKLEKEGKLNPPEGGSNTPYIDSIRKELGISPEGAQPQSNEPYIDHLRASDPNLAPAAPGTPPKESYTEEQKELLAPKETGGAIAAVEAGRSDLEMKRNTNINYSGGFWIGAPFSRNFVATGASATPFSFSQIYGNDTLPDFSGFVEWQPFHSEKFFNVGLIGLFGLTYATGPGQFGVQNLGLVSRTQFNFFEFPVAIGADLRINLAKYIKPNLTIAPMAIGYIESRNDGLPWHEGYSTGIFASAGAWFLLDWVAPSLTWDIYYDSGVKHTYLTAEVSRTTTLSGQVTFDDTAFTIGIAVEF